MWLLFFSTTGAEPDLVLDLCPASPTGRTFWPYLSLPPYFSIRPYPFPTLLYSFTILLRSPFSPIFSPIFSLVFNPLPNLFPNLLPRPHGPPPPLPPRQNGKYQREHGTYQRYKRKTKVEDLNKFRLVLLSRPALVLSALHRFPKKYVKVSSRRDCNLIEDVYAEVRSWTLEADKAKLTEVSWRERTGNSFSSFSWLLFGRTCNVSRFLLYWSQSLQLSVSKPIYYSFPLLLLVVYHHKKNMQIMILMVTLRLKQPLETLMGWEAHI